MPPHADPILITSADDARLGDYRSLADPQALARAGLFVAEGRLVVRRLLASSRCRATSVLVTPTAFSALEDVFRSRDHQIDRSPDHQITRSPDTVPVYLVDQALMNGLVGFNIHRGCLALAERPAPPSPRERADLLAGARRLAVLEGVNNPDNVGGLFRSAAAFGVDAILLGPGCGDPLYRKAIRTSMAAALEVPFLEAGPWPAALQDLRVRGWRLVALTPAADARPLEETEASDRIALLVGAEGSGLTADALAAADERVRIPISGAVDSLNVAVASSIAMFWLRRRTGFEL